MTDTATPLEPMITVAEAAAILRLSKNTVIGLIRSGLIRGHQIGTAKNSGYRTTKTAIQAYLDATATGPLPAAPTAAAGRVTRRAGRKAS